MRSILFVFVFTVFVLTVNGGATLQPRCVLGPGYWCSGALAAKQCGALEYCRQLRLRSGLPPKSARPLKPVPENDDLCGTCQQVLGTIKQALGESKTETEIAQLIKSQICNQIGSLGEACDSLVDMYLPELMSTLSMEIQPKLLCTLLGMCNQTAGAADHGLKAYYKYSQHPVLQLMELQMHPDRKPFATVECPKCRSIVRSVRRLKSAGGSPTQVQAESLIRSTACRDATTLPDKMKCSKTVAHYSPVISQLLSADLDEVTVCLALGSCASSTRPSERRKLVTTTHKSTAGPQCLMCELVLRELERQIGQNRSLVVIETALERVCALLPATVRPECDMFVSQYTPVVVQLLVNGLSPKRVCSAIGLCSALTRSRGQPQPTAKWMLSYMRAQRQHRELL